MVLRYGLQDPDSPCEGLVGFWKPRLWQAIWRIYLTATGNQRWQWKTMENPLQMEVRTGKSTRGYMWTISNCHDLPANWQRYWTLLNICRLLKAGKPIEAFHICFYFAEGLLNPKFVADSNWTHITSTSFFACELPIVVGELTLFCRRKKSPFGGRPSAPGGLTWRLMAWMKRVNALKPSWRRTPGR